MVVDVLLEMYREPGITEEVQTEKKVRSKRKLGKTHLSRLVSNLIEVGRHSRSLP